MAAAVAGDSISEMMMTKKKDHVVIFPFMAQGHTIPLLHLAAALSARADLRVTVLTTPANASSLRGQLPSAVNLDVLPFPHYPILPSGCESTDRLPSPELYPAFLAATTHLRPHFRRFLLHHSCPRPLCVISDFFLGWTLDVCRPLAVPRLVFHGMSAFSMALCKSLWVHQPHSLVSNDQQLFSVPGAPTDLLLTRPQVPDTIRNARHPDDPVAKFVDEVGQADIASWGIVVNSFAAVEREYTDFFQSFYKDNARAWLVGPLCLFNESNNDDDDGNECLQWLAGRRPGSVVYVSFGTQTHVTAAQLEEVAHGLEAVGYEYLWVVRTPAEEWTPSAAAVSGKKGKIVTWAPQAAVLRHEAVGGFISHCGWNSVLESMVSGVPVLAWPMMAEQALNAKFIVDEFGAGIGIQKPENGIVGREEVERGVRELMERKEVRERIEKLARMARAAVKEGGSSRQALDELIGELRKCRGSGENGGGGEPE